MASLACGPYLAVLMNRGWFVNSNCASLVLRNFAGEWCRPLGLMHCASLVLVSDRLGVGSKRMRALNRSQLFTFDPIYRRNTLFVPFPIEDTLRV